MTLTRSGFDPARMLAALADWSDGTVAHDVAVGLAVEGQALIRRGFVESREPDGRRWAPSELALQWQWPEGAAAAGAGSAPWMPTGGRLEADRLDLALLASLAERLPIGAGVRRLLAQLDPAGEVQGLQAQWQGPLDAPQRWQVRGGVRGMASCVRTIRARGAYSTSARNRASVARAATFSSGATASSRSKMIASTASSRAFSSARSFDPGI